MILAVDLKKAGTADDGALVVDGDASAYVRRARGHFWNLLAGQVGNKVLRFAAAVLLARILTPAGFGIFNIGIAIAGVLVTATTLGLPELGGRAVAADHAKARSLPVPVIAGRLGALGVAAALFLAVGHYVWPEEPLFYIATVAVAVAMTLTPDWLARGLERMRVVGLATTTGGLVALIGAVAIVGFPSAGLGLAAFAVAEAAVGLVCWLGIRDAVRPLSFSQTPLWPLLKRSWPIGVATAVTYAYYANVDTVVVAAFHGAHSAGVYSAAYRLFLTFNVIPIFAAYAIFPVLARLTGQQDRASARGALTSLLAQLVVYGALVVAAVEIAGKPILTTIFGDEFSGAATTFVLLALASAWYAPGYGAGYSLIAIGRQRGFVTGAIVAGVLTIALDFALIPPYGLVGAGVATVVGFAGAAVAWIYAQPLETRLKVDIVAVLAALSVGAAVAAAVPELSTAIGLATFAVTTAALGVKLTRKRSI